MLVRRRKGGVCQILESENASDELEALRKSEYESDSKLVATATETAQMAKRKLLGGNPNPAAEGSSAPAGEPNELDKELATLGKRKRKDLADLVRTVGAPIGGWFDKQGKFHVTHAELANRLNRQLERAWAALDFLRSADLMSAIADFAQTMRSFRQPSMRPKTTSTTYWMS